MKRSALVFIFSLLSALFVFSAALAQTPAPRPVTDDQVNAVAKQLYCPVCENIPLDVCPTQACAQWRALIREKLAAGWGAEQIKQYFVDQYGDRVLGTPPLSTRLNLLVYIVPPLAILAGIIILFRALRAWRLPPAPPPESESPAAPADPYIARLEEELKKR